MSGFKVQRHGFDGSGSVAATSDRVLKLALVMTVIAIAMLTTAPRASAQFTKRHRQHENNANRQARIARTVEDTYSHRFELFGGGGYLRWRSGEFLKRNNEITWALGTTYFLNEKLGIEGNLAGAFGNAMIPNVFVHNGDYNPQINEYFFTAGPTYRFYMREKYAVSGTVQGGVSVGNFDGGSKGVPAQTIGLYKSATTAVGIVGVNFDYNFYPNLAFRATPQVTFATFGNGVDPDVGFKGGIVYRFGRVK